MEDDLIARMQQGDHGALRELMESHANLVWHTAWVLLGNRMLAEDAIQDAWVDVWQHINRFERGRAFRPWLLAIVANRCRLALRQSRRPVISLEREAGDALAQLVSLDDAAAHFLRREADAEVRAAYATLSPDQQRMLTLRYYAELELAEIALVMQLPLGTVKSRLHRVLLTLRQRLQTAAVEELP